MLRVFENRVLLRIFRLKRDEVTGEWRRLITRSFIIHTQRNDIRVIKSRRMRWAEQVASMEEIRSAYRLLVGRTEGRSQLRRSRCRWEDNIKMVLKKWDRHKLD